MQQSWLWQRRIRQRSKDAIIIKINDYKRFLPAESGAVLWLSNIQAVTVTAAAAAT
jgi:hypothetical protein